MNNQDKLEENLFREDLKLATISSRMLAMFIDDLLISLIVIAIFWEYIVNAESVEMAIKGINQASGTVILIKIIYQTFFIWNYSATIGKIVAKIKVINIDDFGKPNIFVSLLGFSKLSLSMSSFKS